MKRILILALSVLLIHATYGQTENPRHLYRHGISLYGVGPNVIGSVSYDYFLSPNFNAEVGVGFIGVHAGMKFHFWGGRIDKRWTPYVGASVTRSLFKSVGVDYLPYFPVGIQYIGKNRFNFAFEVAPLQLKLQAWNVVGVKLGYRFGK